MTTDPSGDLDEVPVVVDLLEEPAAGRGAST